MNPRFVLATVSALALSLTLSGSADAQGSSTEDPLTYPAVNIDHAPAGAGVLCVAGAATAIPCDVTTTKAIHVFVPGAVQVVFGGSLVTAANSPIRRCDDTTIATCKYGGEYSANSARLWCRSAGADVTVPFACFK